ncbi:MAG: hypothetical protein ACI3XQ_11400 [Eubacteriales bacterium]
MNYGQALICLDTGETVRNGHERVKVISVGVKRKLGYVPGGEPKCYGDRYFYCTVINEKGSSTTETRPENLMHETEYIERFKEKRADGN